MPNKKITQAIILSAGFGTRLRPLTDDLPKVMVPLGGKPLLEWHIELLKQHGVREIFINLHYLPEKVTEYFGDGSKWDVKIAYAIEQPDILGTAGGVKNFEGKLRGDFFVVYGDVFNRMDYSKMADAFHAKGDIFAMAVVGDTDHPHDSDLVETDSELRFLKVHPKPHEALPERYKSLRAVFIFNERALEYIPADEYYEIDHQLLPAALEKGEAIYGYETDDYIKDIGTPERYRAVEEYLKKRKAE